MTDQFNPKSNKAPQQKTIRMLISELQSFENQELPVQISIDGAATFYPITFVQKSKSGEICGLAFYPDW